MVGTPDPVWGEIGVAVCVRRAGAEIDEAELIGWRRGGIASYKLPRRILFRDALPKSDYGKITKNAVKAAILEDGNIPA